MGSSQSQQCGICERTVIGVFGEDNFLPCHRCGGVYCTECAGLSFAQYQMIKSTENSIEWYCQYCVIGIRRFYDVTG